ncbi:MAG: GNAT family N-acetyltransferase [Oscillospiraceae bacterium]|jgi:RimJ/RimL family protein N-acetyltransferase|nr:GNAT family N-acetyltransferase [Oscillospiraceae bacterium]
MLIKKDELVIRHAEAADVQNKSQVLFCSDDTFQLLITEVDGKPAGEMNFSNMGNKTAQLGIIINDASMRNKGYGTRFLSMLIEHLLMVLGYEKIILDVAFDNRRARHVYEKLGFREKRIKHESNVVDYELTREEFLSRSTGGY